MLRLDINLVFTVINVIILFLLMKKFLFGPITAVMEKRKALIEQQFSAASDAENTAMELKQKYEDNMKGADENAAQIIEAAKKDAVLEYDRIVTDAGAKAERIMDSAVKAVSMEREKALQDVQAEIADLAMLAALKIVQGKSDEESDRLLYSEFLKKAGDSNDTNRN